jgi:hypothetical protein
VAKNDFNSFAAALQKFSDNIPVAANEIKKSLVRNFVNAVVPATPIDTAKARNNWQVSVSSPATSIIEGEVFDSSGAFSFATFVTLEIAKPGDTVYIRSNIPYIRRLNEGYSPQASAQYVERELEGAMRATADMVPTITARVMP